MALQHPRANNFPKGHIIGIEGVDAVGKQTQTALLVSWLQEKGVSVTTISFPDYGTVIGKEIMAFLSGQRKYPVNLQHMLFAANRWEKKDQLERDLGQGKTIIIDRYTESNLAYGVANGLEETWLANLEVGLPRADLVIVLDAPPGGLTKRRPDSTKDQYESNTGFQERVSALYRKLAAEHEWRLVDAEGSIDDVHKAIAKVVSQAIFREAR